MIAGFGFRAAATLASLRDALAQAAGDRRVTALAAPEDKAAAPCLIALAEALRVPVRGVPAHDLRAARTLTRSARVIAARGAGSVAEAAALVAAGPGARLIGPRAVSADRTATCAVATDGTAPLAVVT